MRTGSVAGLRLTVLVVPMLIAGCSAGPRGADVSESTTAASGVNPEFKDSEAKIREYMEAQQRCLTEAGFPARMQEDGGLLIDDGPDDQVEAFQAASRACDAQLPEPPGSQGLTEVETGVLYDLFVEQSACLKAAGYPVPELPSRGTWVQSYLASQAGVQTNVVLPSEQILGRAAAEAQKVCHEPNLEDIYARMTSG